MGLSNPICGLPEMMNTQTDMLKIANIKNVNRYFKMPDPVAMQQLLSAPKEPDAMTLAAQAQYQKVKADAAQALGDQNSARRSKTRITSSRCAIAREDAATTRRRSISRRQSLHAQHTQALGQMAADIFKTAHDGAIDVHQKHADESDQAIADSQAAAPLTRRRRMTDGENDFWRACGWADVQSER